MSGWDQEQEYQAGIRAERERIIKWIEKNRSALELESGEYIYRDHFNSQSLIAFIKGEKMSDWLDPEKADCSKMCRCNECGRDNL